MNAFLIVLSLIVFLVLAFLISGWRNVTQNTRAAAFLFGRFQTVLGEGWQWWWPSPFGRHDEYSAKPEPISDTVAVNTKEWEDKVSGGSNRVTLKFSFPITPDPELLNTYRGWDFEKIVADLKAEVRSQLNILAGQYSYSVFIESHRAIETIINCLLRLDTPPHHHAKDFDWAGDDNVLLEKRIEFYTSCHKKINEWLKTEEKRSLRSHFEKRYGIDIGNFHLDPAAFSEEMMKALELERQTRQKLSAVSAISSKIESEAKKLPKLPITEVKDLVQTTLGVPTRIVTVRNDKGSTDLWFNPDDKDS